MVKSENQIRKPWLIVAVLMVFAGACNQIGGIEPASFRQCVDVRDCVVEVPACSVAIACNDGRCTFEDAPHGTPFNLQVAGDCSEIVCDGNGGTVSALVLEDLPDDGNPCTIDTCNDRTPLNIPADEVPCFTGPSWKKDKGICKSGFQRCVNGELFGQCKGEVLPAVEDCDWNDLDEDCDGQTNEEGPSCVCVPGDIIECYTGPEFTAGTGICRVGKTSCESNGLQYRDCIDEQTPMLESCDSGQLDEDCDGKVNESGVNCLCGDGFVSVDLEICDDGNTDSTDACKSNCELAQCGDGIVQPINGETCDDGNGDSTDSCTTLCRIATCGDGVVQPSLGEVCDDNNLDPTDKCTDTCQLAACGDGIAQFGEACDDGNTVDGDGCPANCTLPAVAVTAGEFHSCALFSDGSVKCWGAAYYLGLGDGKSYGDAPDEMGNYLPRIKIGVGKSIKTIDVSRQHTCVILNDDSVKCWGRNLEGQLGLGNKFLTGTPPENFPAVDLGTGKTATAVTVGLHHSCAILDDGSVKCWGYGSFIGAGSTDNLGDDPQEMGDNLPRVALGMGRTAKSIAAGESHTCAILDDDALKCWGYNDYGELGLGDVQDRGYVPGQMGDALPSVNLGDGKTAKAVTVGGRYTCAILNDNTVKCWGAGGALGLGSTEDWGRYPQEMGNSLPVVNLGQGRTAVAIASGGGSSCAILDNDSVKCWGSNWAGQLGIGWLGVSQGDEPGEMGDNLPAVNLGTGVIVEHIRVGKSHACALVNGGRAKCWGSNFHGQLGQGHIEDLGMWAYQMGDNLPFIEFW